VGVVDQLHLFGRIVAMLVWMVLAAFLVVCFFNLSLAGCWRDTQDLVEVLVF
jgi:hypothetical protein